MKNLQSLALLFLCFIPGLWVCLLCFVFSFPQGDYDVLGHRFLSNYLFGVHWASWISKFMSLTKLLKRYFAPHFFSCPSETLIDPPQYVLLLLPLSMSPGQPHQIGTFWTFPAFSYLGLCINHLVSSWQNPPPPQQSIQMQHSLKDVVPAIIHSFNDYKALFRCQASYLYNFILPAMAFYVYF